MAPWRPPVVLVLVPVAFRQASLPEAVDPDRIRVSGWVAPRVGPMLPDSVHAGLGG